jgi:hypothetical protein
VIGEGSLVSTFAATLSFEGQMATTGLQLPHISPSQSGKMNSINAIADGLDGALTQQATLDVSGGSDVTPSPSTVLPFMCLRLIGILTGNINLILPSSSHLYLIIDAATGAFTVTVKCGAGSTVTLNPGDIRLVFCDGLNVIAPN